MSVLTPLPIHVSIVGGADPVQLPSYKAIEFLLINPYQNTSGIIIGRINNDATLPTGAQTHTSTNAIYPMQQNSSIVHSGGKSRAPWLDLSDLWAYAATNVELIIFPAVEFTI